MERGRMQSGERKHFSLIKTNVHGVRVIMFGRTSERAQHNRRASRWSFTADEAWPDVIKCLITAVLIMF